MEIIDGLSKLAPEALNEIPQESLEEMERKRKMFSLLHKACGIFEKDTPEPDTCVKDPIKRFNWFE